MFTMPSNFGEHYSQILSASEHFRDQEEISSENGTKSIAPATSCLFYSCSKENFWTYSSAITANLYINDAILSPQPIS